MTTEQELESLKVAQERQIKAIGNMLIALNQCGREIQWNTSSEIEAAYAELKEIYKAATCLNL